MSAPNVLIFFKKIDKNPILKLKKNPPLRVFKTDQKCVLTLLLVVHMTFEWLLPFKSF